PSHVSLFTGRYPDEHGIRDNISLPLAADVPLLAERFQRAGFATGAFIASAVLDRQSGLGRGFDLYSDRFDPGADRKPGDVVAAEAIGWLQGKKKFFAWVHLYDVHAPYAPARVCGESREQSTCFRPSSRWRGSRKIRPARQDRVSPCRSVEPRRQRPPQAGAAQMPNRSPSRSCRSCTTAGATFAPCAMGAGN